MFKLSLISSSIPFPLHVLLASDSHWVELSSEGAMERVSVLCKCLCENDICWRPLHAKNERWCFTLISAVCL
jgi:hypothetical protein